MTFRSIKSLLVKTFSVFSLLLATEAFAEENHTPAPAGAGVEATATTEAHGAKKEGDFNVTETILEHIKDDHSWHLWGHTSIHLPVILKTSKGFEVFSSEKLVDEHHEPAIYKGNFDYKLIEGKTKIVDANGNVDVEASKQLWDFSITKNVSLIFLVFGIMFFMFSRMAKSYKSNKGMPKGMGRLLEPIVLYVRDEIAVPNIGEKHYKRYMSYLLTVFFFVWIVNLFGLTPIGMNLTNNIAVTFCLAIITYLITTFSGNKNYWKHIFWMPGVPVPMKIILAPIELLGTFIKPFALMIRLYANITAGHIVLMSIIGMMFVFNNWLGSSLSFLLAFVLGILELLVAALQAYIFTVLSALYFGMAVEEHHHDEAH